MGSIKQINIKNRTFFFFDDMINIKNLDSSLIKIDQESFKNIDIYQIAYITIKKIHDYQNIYSVNPYLIIGKVDGFIKEKNENKYLVFYSTDENKEVFKKYTELSNTVKNETKTINGGKKGKYGKDFINIQFNLDDNLPLKKLLKMELDGKKL